MATYVQAGRPLMVTTPLGKDKLLLRGFRGSEAVSRLFSFQLDLIAENKTEIAFDKLLGEKITIQLGLPGEEKRHFNGICNRIAQGERDKVFTSYRMEIVPKFWLLTRKAQSRIFQGESVPDILKKVLAGLDITWDIQGTFHPRDFCVQYRETDFNFASRLMEEEGIYYFFKHSDGDHMMVVANSQNHPKLPTASKIIYEEIIGGVRDEDRIHDWEKVQELRSGKYTLWDHCFELPHKHLETDKTILDTVQAGTVGHKLKVGGNDKLEIYDWPGEYAQRFDGVNPGGGDRAGDLQKIFEDNKRTVEIRMQEEAVPGLVIRGGSNCRHFSSGHKFTLERHFNADGEYLLTSVEHWARGAGEYRSETTGEFQYENTFSAIPAALPFRPPRVTPRPVVQGTQTAVVVGSPSSEEIFTDKYGRVKVHFHWDREGKYDASSSCWIRVGTLWAGKQWGVIHIPRIGQEVIVDFLEGDPDQPIVVGSVYNADMMPPYTLPANKTQSGIKSRSTLGGGTSNFNEFRFEDKKGQEQVFLHAEKNQDIEVENNETHWVGHDRTKTIDNDETTHVKHDRTETVDNNETITIGHDRTEQVVNNESLKVGFNQTLDVGVDQKVTVGMNQDTTVGVNRSVKVGASETHSIGATRSDTIGASDSLTVGASRTTNIGLADTLNVGATLTIQTAGATTIQAGGATTITTGGIISISAGGALTIQAGGAVAISAAGAVALNAAAITLNSAVVTCAGVLLATSVVTAAVASPLYTPGVGNMI